MTDAELEEIKKHVLKLQVYWRNQPAFDFGEDIRRLIAEVERLRQENLNLDGLLRAQAHEIGKMQTAHESNRKLKQKIYRWERWAEKHAEPLVIAWREGVDMGFLVDDSGDAEKALAELEELRK